MQIETLTIAFIGAKIVYHKLSQDSWSSNNNRPNASMKKVPPYNSRKEKMKMKVDLIWEKSVKFELTLKLSQMNTRIRLHKLINVNWEIPFNGKAPIKNMGG